MLEGEAAAAGLVDVARDHAARFVETVTGTVQGTVDVVRWHGVLSSTGKGKSQASFPWICFAQIKIPIVFGFLLLTSRGLTDLGLNRICWNLSRTWSYLRGAKDFYSVRIAIISH